MGLPEVIVVPPALITSVVDGDDAEDPDLGDRGCCRPPDDDHCQPLSMTSISFQKTFPFSASVAMLVPT